MRAEVKERCAGLILSTFAAIGSTGTVAEMVELELMDYRYTFPTMNNVSPFFFCEAVLSHSQANGHQLPPMRTRPYRNKRIITVIHDLYFTGGAQSFSHRFIG